MRRIAAAAVAVVAAALAVATPAAAQPFTDVTPPDSAGIFCPADLGGGGAGLAWMRFGETSGGRDTLDLAAAGLDPATPPTTLVGGGGCAHVATAPSGASLVALNLTGFSAETGPVVAVDRAPGGTTSKPLVLSRDERAEGVAAALASSGAALVAWVQSTPVPGRDPDDQAYSTAVHVAAREAGGAFDSLGTLGTESGGPAVGIDEAGFGVAVWSEGVPGARDVSKVLVATRAPGGGFSAPHEVGRIGKGAAEDGDELSLVVAPTGEALLAVSDDGGVRVGSGTTRTGIGALRSLYDGTTGAVTAVLSASGAAAVAWAQPPDRNGPRFGVAVSDRPPGGDFGAPHGLAETRSRLGGGEVRNLRLASAPDGRVIASWTVEVTAGDRSTNPVPVAALRRADGRWEAVVALAGPCREQTDAFPGFDAAGRPRVTFVDNGLISGGDYGFPYDQRIRVARLDAVPATPVAPPKVTLQAARRQVLRHDEVKLRVRCERACDAKVFAIVGGKSGPSSGLFPQWGRLRAERWYNRITLAHESYFAATNALDDEGRTVKVKLVVHACDSAGRIARARRTISLRIPRSPPG